MIKNNLDIFFSQKELCVGNIEWNTTPSLRELGLVAGPPLQPALASQPGTAQTRQGL